MSEIEAITRALVEFREKRDWRQFHTSKDLAAAIGVEAAELNEIFLWKTTAEAETADKERIKEELADVLAFCFLLAEKHKFSIPDIILEKIKKNEKKYPVEKSRGNALKYDQF
ncbi:MAG: nucleotide pyrophosphohydrolase [Bacteroidales bacterium]|nr:nucleotide pyrophosphohydrolase [Bacteroidales bacterium]